MSAGLAGWAQEGAGDLVELSPFAVQTVVGLNEAPALGLSTPISPLRFTPAVDLQARGYGELQSDLTVRGSTFEQTGVVLGAAPLYDPQTGHYTTEIPFPVEMLALPQLLTGRENALRGFNAGVGTVHFAWAPIVRGGLFEVGAGTDDLLFGRIYAAERLGEGPWAIDLGFGHGRGDGTVEGGDHRFRRGAVRLQRARGGAQTDLALGALDKFYGWPGMYTADRFAAAFGRPALETEDYQALLLTLNHRQRYGIGSFWELGAAYRELEDDYQFDRELFPDLPFEHLTRALSLGLEGTHRLDDAWALRYTGALVADELVRSSTLTHGDPSTGNDFTARTYGKVAGAVERRWQDPAGASYRLEAGFRAATTDQDRGQVQPLAALERETAWRGGLLTTFVEYAATSQVVGYTALRSDPVGLFGGDPNLGRQTTRTAEWGAHWEREGLELSGSLFFRRDDELVDWVYRVPETPGTPVTAREAAQVDLETWGVELIARRATPWGRWQVSAAWLEKSPDYGRETIDASYYALNFPVLRLTAGALWRVAEGLELAAETEYIQAEENALRASGEAALLASAMLRYRLGEGSPWTAELLVDNLFDDDFEEFPGTPAVGRHGSVRLRYSW